MTTADKLTKITSQLIGDISRLPGAQLDSAGEAQLAQLLTDAFETVGHIALGQADESLLGPKDPCRCGEYETCPTCIEEHRRFRAAQASAGGAASYIDSD